MSGLVSAKEPPKNRLDDRPRAGDEGSMRLLFTLLLIVFAAWPLPAHAKRHVHAAAIRVPVGMSTAQERLLRRRVIRLARIAMYERRQAMLSEFLARAHTLDPLLQDAQVLALAGGIEIGPTVVLRDSLGGAVVHATIRNTASVPAAPLVTVRLRGADGSEASASIALDLAPGASRHIELAAPSVVRPVALRWSLFP